MGKVKLNSCSFLKFHWYRCKSEFLKILNTEEGLGRFRDVLSWFESNRIGIETGIGIDIGIRTGIGTEIGVGIES